MILQSAVQGGAEAPAVPVQPVVVGANSPREVWQALRAQRTELREQLQRLEERRLTIAQRLRDGGAAEGADRAGLEARIADLDQQIVGMYKQLSAADAEVARAAAIPGAVGPQTPPFPQQGPPEEVFVVAIVFMFTALLPISIAFARRIWRRGSAAIASVPKEIHDRFSRLEEAVESVAIEVERIGEGQRFVTHLLAQQPTPRAMAELPAPPDAGADGRKALG